MGNDLTVVNAARVSFHKISNEFSTKDAGLIKYLAKHNHWTPFSHVMLQFRIKMPIFVAREWYRHTVGFTRNEVSRRYVTDDPEFFKPDVWRIRADNKKQGSGVDADPVFQDRWSSRYFAIIGQASMAYKLLIDEGCAPEMARMILPQSMYTEFIETASLYAYARLCRLRISPDAQNEIKKYAESVSYFCQQVAPHSWEALTNDNSSDK